MKLRFVLHIHTHTRLSALSKNTVPLHVFFTLKSLFYV